MLKEDFFINPFKTYMTEERPKLKFGWKRMDVKLNPKEPHQKKLGGTVIDRSNWPRAAPELTRRREEEQAAKAEEARQKQLQKDLRQANRDELLRIRLEREKAKLEKATTTIKSPPTPPKPKKGFWR